MVSRIGKNPIGIPAGVTVKVDGNTVTVKGSKGELARDFRDDIEITAEKDQVVCRIRKQTKMAVSLWGTCAAHIRNMIHGVTKGYSKKLAIVGIGYKARVEGSKLILNLGFSHPVEIESPAGIAFQVEKNNITVSGVDKETVGEIAARIHALKKPEPYKGKGIYYEGEVARRKAGKKATA